MSYQYVVAVNFAEIRGKILNPRFVRGGFRRIVEVLHHFAKLHIAALYQASNKRAHKFLAGPVAHKLGLLQKHRDFGGELLLHGAVRFFGSVETPKVGPPYFFA